MPNIASQAKQGSSEPETPPEVAARRPIALTHIAAESGNAEERAGLTTVGQSGRAQRQARRQRRSGRPRAQPTRRDQRPKGRVTDGALARRTLRA